MLSNSLWWFRIQFLVNCWHLVNNDCNSTISGNSTISCSFTITVTDNYCEFVYRFFKVGKQPIGTLTVANFFYDNFYFYFVCPTNFLSEGCGLKKHLFTNKPFCLFWSSECLNVVRKIISIWWRPNLTPK